MKNIALLVLILIVSACGNSKSSNNDQEEQSHRESTCGSMKSRQCIPMANFQVVSNRAFPSKMKVGFLFDGSSGSYTIVNECDGYDYDAERVVRNATSGLINFREPRGLMDVNFEIEITDLGENCDNDAFFAKESVKPVKVTGPDGKITGMIRLSN